MAGLIIMGIGFSTVYPSVYAFFESQLTLSNTTTGVFISVAGISSAVFPTVCGQFIAAQPLALIYMNFILTIFVLSIFIAFNVIIVTRKCSVIV